MTNQWTNPSRASEFLIRADRLPHRGVGESVLVEDLATVMPGRVLDLGCGDARLSALVLAAYPDATAVCFDLSPIMLDAAGRRFGGDARVKFVQGLLDDALPDLGVFDAVISSLAIHHLEDARKRELSGEIAQMLNPGGIFANLEIVESPTQALHDQWRDEMGARDDPSDRLRDLDSQLTWLREAAFRDVDCIWKWRSLALMRGQLPSGPGPSSD